MRDSFAADEMGLGVAELRLVQSTVATSLRHYSKSSEPTCCATRVALSMNFKCTSSSERVLLANGVSTPLASLRR